MMWWVMGAGILRNAECGMRKDVKE